MVWLAVDALAHQEGQFVGILAGGWHSNDALLSGRVSQ